ncbi:MAG: transglutaminase-like domain-containing protein [Nanoarchaeota archaeon]|nr:transglutaminase-like domain-containing protein [Nanoarchaeota archaeon]
MNLKREVFLLLIILIIPLSYAGSLSPDYNSLLEKHIAEKSTYDLIYGKGEVYRVKNVTLSFMEDKTSLFLYKNEFIYEGGIPAVYTNEHEFGVEIGVYGKTAISVEKIKVVPLTSETSYSFSSFKGELDFLEVLSGEVQVFSNGKDLFKLSKEKLKINKENFKLFKFSDVKLAVYEGESYVGIGNSPGLFFIDEMDKLSEFYDGGTSFLIDQLNAGYFLKKGEYSSAVKNYEAIIKKYPKENLREVLIKNSESKIKKEFFESEKLTSEGKYSEAVQKYKSLLILANDPEIKSLANFYIGYNYILDEDLNQALIHFNKVDKESSVFLSFNSILDEEYYRLIKEEGERIEKICNLLKDRRSSVGFLTSIKNIWDNLFDQEFSKQIKRFEDQQCYGRVKGLELLSERVESYGTFEEAVLSLPEEGYLKSFTKSNPLVFSLLKIEELGGSLTEEDIFKINEEVAKKYELQGDYEGAYKVYSQIVEDYKRVETSYGSYYFLPDGSFSLYQYIGDEVYSKENIPAPYGVTDIKSLEKDPLYKLFLQKSEERIRLSKIDGVNPYYSYYSSANLGLLKSGIKDFGKEAFNFINDELVSVKGIAEQFLFIKVLSGGKLGYNSFKRFSQDTGGMIVESRTGFAKVGEAELLANKNFGVSPPAGIFSSSSDFSKSWGDFKIGDYVKIKRSNPGDNDVGKIVSFSDDSKGFRQFRIQVSDNQGIPVGHKMFSERSLVELNKFVGKITSTRASFSFEKLRKRHEFSFSNFFNSLMKKKSLVTEYQYSYGNRKFVFVEDKINDQVYADLLREFDEIYLSKGHSVKTIDAFARGISKRMGGSDDAATDCWEHWSSIIGKQEKTLTYIYFGELLEGGIGVCRHRSVIFDAVLKNYGFESRWVGGYISRGDSVGHAWVEIKIGNKWFVVEPAERIYHLDKRFYPDSYISGEGLWEHKILSKYLLSLIFGKFLK